ncbi:hypothetical protein MYAM1_001973 [Malassezia yamatoensis]|uniref:RRM domain-containing protein n=1 Tax=Malassezia yamatoensis TaxID=253288 RepID=A0AAJ5YRQ9_9BASI|nr:hypothetical protein MYAM1_001973 [Malassezia yamatoensis]
MMLSKLDAAPRYLAEEEQEELQSSTPKSFKDIPAVLVYESANVVAKLQPVPAYLGFEAQDEVTAKGHLWVTQQSVSFLPDTKQSPGFQIPFPSIALHAVAKSLPDGILNGISDHQSYDQEACIYCQLDDHPERDDVENEEDATLCELWIVAESKEHLEKLFDAMSHCAGLHPSNGGTESCQSHPLAGLAPFGSGAEGNLDELLTENNQDHREDTQVNDNDDAHVAKKSYAYTQQTAQISNTLMLTNLPAGFFDSEQLNSQLLELLRTYGPLVDWTPLASFGRGVVVYEREQDAAQAKWSLDRLLLLYEDENEQAHINDAPLRSGKDSDVLRVYFSAHTPLIFLPDGDAILARDLVANRHQYLELPQTGRNFLISPPGSPPVGWEPREEDGPNKETLAQDLMDALHKLADPQPSEASASRPPEEIVVMEPNQEHLSHPGVIVHPTENLGLKTAPDCNISSVKATAESMQGRPVPTSRPPM